MTEDTDEPDVDDVEPDDDEEAQPEVSDDAGVTVDLEAVDDAIDDESDDQERDENEPETSEDTGSGPLTGGEGQTLGDMYVKGLCAASNGVIEKYDGDPIDESVARDLGLDDAMNEWIQSKGGSEDLPPGQALAIGTTMFAMAVLASNPEVVNAVLEVIEG